jgi:hypothetical protein
MSQSSGPVAAFDRALTGFESVGLLAEELRSTCPAPINGLQITAMLESAGVTDVVAAQRYGYPDVFALADSVAQTLALSPVGVECPVATEPAVEADDRWSALMDYMRGPLGVVPLILLMSIVGVYQSFGEWEGSRVLVLSAATIGSLLVTSGFIQVAARKGSSYLSQGYAGAAARFVGGVGLLGLVTVVVTGGLIASIGRLMGWLGVDEVALMLGSYVVLSCLWILSAGLSIFRRVYWFGIALGLGVGLSRVVLSAMELVVRDRQAIIGLSAGIGALATLGVGVWAMRRAIASAARASEAGPRRVRVPPLPQLVYNLAPYFAYGIVYILGVLSGHVGGWVGRVPEGMARMDAIAVSELGLTIALLAYILVGGFAEQTMQRFWRRVHLFQDEAPAEEPGAFVARLRDFHQREQRRFIVALAAATGLVVLSIALSLVVSGRLLGMVWNDHLSIVLAGGLVGCALLAVGAFDCMMLITLSRPVPALLALSCGACVTLVASLAMGVLFGFAWGAVGMVFGNVVVLLVARTNLGRVIDHADYFYFTSF